MEIAVHLQKFAAEDIVGWSSRRRIQVNWACSGEIRVGGISGICLLDKRTSYQGRALTGRDECLKALEHENQVDSYQPTYLPDAPATPKDSDSAD